MQWPDVRAAYPDQWLVIEALGAHTEQHRRLFDEVAVVAVCVDGEAAMRRYRELRREHPARELYFVHTANRLLEIEERPWIGIRRIDAPTPA